jgi:2'-5' RNA ligase
MPLVPPPKRLFVALMPDRATQTHLQRHCKAWDWPDDCKPVPFGRYHLTLHFIGDVGLGPEQRLRQALREVTMQPLELDLCEPELWPNQVAVLRPAEHRGLRALHARIAQALPAAGLQPEPREYKPHLTLARHAAGARAPARTETIRWSVHEFALVWSVTPAAGKPARYEVLEWFGAPPAQIDQGPAESGQAGEQVSLLRVE